MSVEVRLFATLRAHLPAGSGRSAARLDVPEGTTVADILERLNIPTVLASLVLVNGRFEPDRHRRLTEGCVLSVFPAVAGG